MGRVAAQVLLGLDVRTRRNVRGEGECPWREGVGDPVVSWLDLEQA